MPVVARKKGLDGHYEKADGNPQPKKVLSIIAPVRIFSSLCFQRDHDVWLIGARYIWLRPY